MSFGCGSSKEVRFSKVVSSDTVGTNGCVAIGIDVCLLALLVLSASCDSEASPCASLFVSDSPKSCPDGMVISKPSTG